MPAESLPIPACKSAEVTGMGAASAAKADEGPAMPSERNGMPSPYGQKEYHAVKKGGKKFGRQVAWAESQAWPLRQSDIPRHVLAKIGHPSRTELLPGERQMLWTGTRKAPREGARTAVIEAGCGARVKS